MREILLRGQTLRYGEKVKLNGEKIKSNWVYGGIFPQNGEGDFAIIYQQKPTIKKYPVYADTVGQYTGMLDKNGTKIFEGDIVDFSDRSDGDSYGVIKYDTNETEFAIVYDSIYTGLGRQYHSRDIEVIGNIYDNPELAKQPYKTVEIRCETKEDYNDFEKILDLSQPRKPIKSDEQVIRYVQTYECPNCGKAFTGKGISNYCYHCGQKLDWSDETEGEN